MDFNSSWVGGIIACPRIIRPLESEGVRGCQVVYMLGRSKTVSQSMCQNGFPEDPKTFWHPHIHLIFWWGWMSRSATRCPDPLHFPPPFVGGGNSGPPLIGFWPCRESTMHPTSPVARLVRLDTPYRPGLTGGSTTGASSTTGSFMLGGEGCFFAPTDFTRPPPIIIISHRLSSYLIMRTR